MNYELRLRQNNKKHYSLFFIHYSNAFTLVELLVVISIMAIIGIIAFANYGNLKKDQDLRAAAGSVHGLVRLAQSNSTARLKCGVDVTGSGANWIVSFAANKTTVNLNCQIGSNPAVPNVVPPLVLTNNITVSSINGCNHSVPVTVTYSPLYGGVTFDDGTTIPTCVESPATSSMNVVLIDAEGNTRTVIINKGGSVEIQ